jgi:hypothetical protein
MVKVKYLLFRVVVYVVVFVFVAAFVPYMDNRYVHASQNVLFPELQTSPVILKASDVLPGNILKGPNYAIDQKIINDGLVNTYTLKTDYGRFKVESTASLMIRINELIALGHMEKLKKTKVFTKAVKKGVVAPLETAKGVVMEPVKTVSGVATGIGRWFSDVGRSVVSSDPHQENVLKTAIGYSAAKRKFAYEYRIDPYTKFEPVQKELGEIGRAAVAGGLTPKLAFGALKKPVSTVLRATGSADTMKKMVRDKSPAELENINEDKLKDMGVHKYIADKFLKNPHYNPQEKTLLVGELYRMSGVKNRKEFIAAASEADEESVARFMRIRAEMMADYNANILPAVKIVTVNGLPFLQRIDKVLVGLFPLDYVTWNERFVRKEMTVSRAIDTLLKVNGKELWISGTFDVSARKALESRGWKVKERVGDKLEKQ